MDDPPIYQGICLSFVAITQQAKQFLDSLHDVDVGHFHAAAAILDSSAATGRPPAGRAQRVQGSSAGLFELRITPRGRKGTHLRLLYVRDGSRILCVRGIAKKSPRIRRREIELADRAVKDYLRPRDEDP